MHAITVNTELRHKLIIQLIKYNIYIHITQEIQSHNEYQDTTLSIQLEELPSCLIPIAVSSDDWIFLDIAVDEYEVFRRMEREFPSSLPL